MNFNILESFTCCFCTFFFLEGLELFFFFFCRGYFFNLLFGRFCFFSANTFLILDVFGLRFLFLTPLMVDKICIEVAAKNKIKIKKQSGGFAGLMSHFKNHIDFVEVCQSNISPDGWYPSPNWRSRFCRKFNLSYTSNKAKTYFSKEQLLNQLVPSLETVYTLRKVFDIPPCQGRVINLDETMFYLSKPSKRAWT